MSEGESTRVRTQEGAATAPEWRGVQRELRVVVQGTLLEARQEAVTVEWTLQEGEVQEPVRGGARTGRRR